MVEKSVKASQEVAKAAASAFANYSRALRSYVGKRVRRPDSVRDLTQEIFERFLQLPKADTVRDPRAYLFGIASHVVSEFWYQERRDRVAFDSDAVVESSNELARASSGDAAEQLVVRGEINRALSRLPTNQRAVLLLVKRDGYTYDEVSDQTGLSAETVRMYVHEARAVVKMILKSNP